MMKIQICLDPRNVSMGKGVQSVEVLKAMQSSVFSNDAVDLQHPPIFNVLFLLCADDIRST